MGVGIVAALSCTRSTKVGDSDPGRRRQLRWRLLLLLLLLLLWAWPLRLRKAASCTAATSMGRPT